MVQCRSSFTLLRFLLLDLLWAEKAVARIQYQPTFSPSGLLEHDADHHENIVAAIKTNLQDDATSNSTSPSSSSMEPRQILPDGVTLFTWPSNPPNMTLGPCEGDCDVDSDCGPGLYCYQKNVSDTSVPGCLGFDDSRTDFCIPVPTASPSETPTTPPTDAPTDAPSLAPTPVQLPVLFIYPDNPPNISTPIGLCEGDCDDDTDCAPGLICYERERYGVKNQTTIPGCQGTDRSRTDYCIRPSALKDLLLTLAPTQSPTPAPTTPVPTAAPTLRPSSRPSFRPSDVISVSPTVTSPSDGPSDQPSIIPIQSVAPSLIPTTSSLPSMAESAGPTLSNYPTADPSPTPSHTSEIPSFDPSRSPTMVPSSPKPISLPSSSPTPINENDISLEPSPTPSLKPSISATQQPSLSLSVQPTLTISGVPSFMPSSELTVITSEDPSSAPLSDTAVIRVTLFFDPWPEEVSWRIVDLETTTNLAIVPTGTYQPGVDRADQNVVLLSGVSYGFVIEDSLSDGMAGIGIVYQVTLLKSVDQSEDDLILLEGDGVYTSARTETFYVPSPDEYPTSAPIQPTVSPVPTVFTVPVYLTIVLDMWHQETSWQIVSANDPSQILVDRPPDSYRAGISVTEEIFLPPSTTSTNDSYVFTIHDFFEDGIVNGRYIMTTQDGTILFEGDGAFGAERSHSFSVPDL